MLRLAGLPCLENAWNYRLLGYFLKNIYIKCSRCVLK